MTEAQKIERARAKRERRRRKPEPAVLQVPGRPPVGKFFKGRNAGEIYQVQSDGAWRRVVVPIEAQA